MTRALAVIGAAGFGRGTLDVVAALNAIERRWELLGVVDDAPSAENLARLEVRGVHHLGSLDQALQELAGPICYVVAIGWPDVRARLAARCDSAGWEAVTLIHPAANLGSRVSVGAGSVIYPGAGVSTNVTIGRHVQLNMSAILGHDTVLEDFVSVNPGGIVSGDCVIGEGTLVGAGSVILQGLRTGRGAVIGAAACVTRDVPAGVVAKGVPARW